MLQHEQDPKAARNGPQQRTKRHVLRKRRLILRPLEGPDRVEILLEQGSVDDYADAAAQDCKDRRLMVLNPKAMYDFKSEKRTWMRGRAHSIRQPFALWEQALRQRSRMEYGIERGKG